LNLGANGLDVLNDDSDFSGVVEFIEEDIQWALTTVEDYLIVTEIAPGSRTRVTVWFVNRLDSSPTYNGDVRLAQRDALRLHLMNPASLYRTTVTGQYVDEDSYVVHDPPATPAGALSIVPSIFTLCLALLATMVGRA